MGEKGNHPISHHRPKTNCNAGRGSQPLLACLRSHPGFSLILVQEKKEVASVFPTASGGWRDCICRGPSLIARSTDACSGTASSGFGPPIASQLTSSGLVPYCACASPPPSLPVGVFVKPFSGFRLRMELSSSTARRSRRSCPNQCEARRNF